METQHCYSNRLLKPFARVLRKHASVPAEMIAALDQLEDDGRIPITTAHELLRGAIVLTGEEDLGLEAAAAIEVGDYGALEYAASTAQTAGEALSVIGRYMALINDALTFSIDQRGEYAVIVLENAVVMPRAAEDFELGAFYAAFKARAGRDRMPFPFEVRFVHPAPSDLAPYLRVFSERARFRFGEEKAGFAFPRIALSDPLPTADPKLHAVVRELAERLLRDLPKPESFTGRVRALLADGLASGKCSAAQIAAVLHVSPSTLNRRLEREGTGFKELFEDMRRGLALRYVGETDLALSEIAFLLGFSQAPAFHRAFKRWTDQTPLEYRSSRRG